jgi:hypothetical protein
VLWIYVNLNSQKELALLSKTKYIVTFVGTAFGSFGVIWTIIEALSFLGFSQLQNTGLKGLVLMSSAALNLASLITFIAYYFSDEKIEPNKNSKEFLLEKAGITAFYPDREHYKLRGDKAKSISGYISQAKANLTLVSISFITGRDYEGTLDIIRDKLNARDANFHFCISLLNPNQNYLLDSLSHSFGKTRAELKKDINRGLQELIAFRNSLSGTAKARFKIYLHNTIPFASAIIIDESTMEAKIQLETKSYQAPYNKSIAIEVVPTEDKGGLYYTLLNSYKRLLDDATPVLN